MHYTDSHLHLQDYSPKEAVKIYKNALKNNVCEFVIPSAQPSDWKRIIKIRRRFSGTIAAFGIHPWYIENADENQLDILERYLQKFPELWVGECGIDRIKNPDVSVQKIFFSKQAKLAEKYNRPLIVHCVKADAEMEQFFPILPKHTVFHSFVGSIEWGKKLQKHGFYLGLNFSFFQKDNAAEMLKQLDLDKILLETDAPYQQKRDYVKNSPENLPILAAGISAVLGLSETEIAAVLARNFKNFKQE